MALFHDEDLNGDVYILGGDGEVEQKIDLHNYVFPETGWPDYKGDIRPAWERKHYITFIRLNTTYLSDAGRSIQVAADVSYIRWLAVREGLVQKGQDAKTFFCKYSEVLDVAPATVSDDKWDAEENKALKDGVAARLTEGRKAFLRRHFADIVCCIAFVFRVRGHHYLDNTQGLYDKLWTRSLHKTEELQVTWEILATDALHAIFPVKLDNYWIACARAKMIAGALAKRIDAAPAGRAAIAAVDKGLSDVMMLFPDVVERVPEAYAELKRIKNVIGNQRWIGSVNARLYGAPNLLFDEGKIGVLASVVHGVYNTLAEGSALLESKALQRVAHTAPVTGAVIGRAALRATQSEKFMLLGTPVQQRDNGQ